MVPFFSIFLKNGFSSEHYGTEIHILSEPMDKEKLYILLGQMEKHVLIHEDNI